MSAAFTPSRRDFLRQTAFASGGLVIAIALPACSKQDAVASGSVDAPTNVDVNAWLKVGSDNRITFLCDRSEMGQGVYTSLTMLVAEELGVPPERIHVEFAPANEVYTNNLLGTQITGGSTSVRDAWEKLRKAGAQARTMLLSAAARDWGVKAQDCHVEDGFCVSPKGMRVTFGQVAAAAATFAVPEKVVLKPASEFQFIGTPVKRLDTPMKVDGSARYGIDVRLPDMLYAALTQPPTLGGKVKSFDDSAAKTMPGYKATVQTSSGVAVVADSWYRARKARDVVKIEWDNGPNASLDDAAILKGLAGCRRQRSESRPQGWRRRCGFEVGGESHQERIHAAAAGACDAGAAELHGVGSRRQVRHLCADADPARRSGRRGQSRPASKRRT